MEAGIHSAVVAAFGLGLGVGIGLGVGVGIGLGMGAGISSAIGVVDANLVHLSAGQSKVASKMLAHARQVLF